MTGSAIHVQLVDSLDALAPHADAWHALLESALPGRGFFYRLPMLRAMAPVHASADHVGGHRSPFVLLAWRGEHLVGGLPLILERKPLTRAGLRRLMLWGGDGTALGVEGDIPLLGAPSAQTDVVRAFRETLFTTHAAAWDVLECGYLRGDSAAQSALAAGDLLTTWHDEPLASFMTDLTLDDTTWRATRSSGRVRELGRLRRRLESAHAVSFVHTASLSADQRTQIATLHAARQEVLSAAGRHRESPFADPVRAGAIFSVLDAAEVLRCGRYALLYANDELAAFLLCLREGPTLLAWLTAVDERFLAMGAGGLLFWETVQREREARRHTRLEFGPGHTFIKETVATHVFAPRHGRVANPAMASGLRLKAYDALVQARQQLHGHL